MEMATEPVLPPPEPWKDQETTYRLPGPTELRQNTVLCRSCSSEFPLADYLQGELNEEQCPVCGYMGPDSVEHHDPEPEEEPEEEPDYGQE